MNKIFYRAIGIKGHFKYNRAYYIKYSSDISINLKTGMGRCFSFSDRVTSVKIKITEVK